MKTTDTIINAKLTRQPKVLAKVVFANAEVLESDIADAKPGTTINVAAFDNEAREALSKLSNEDTFSAYAHTATNPKDGSLRLIVEGLVDETTDSTEYVEEWWNAPNLQSLLDAGWVVVREYKPAANGNRYHLLSHPQAAPDEKDWITFDEFADGTVGTCPWMF